MERSAHKPVGAGGRSGNPDVVPKRDKGGERVRVRVECVGVGLPWRIFSERAREADNCVWRM